MLVILSKEDRQEEKQRGGGECLGLEVGYHETRVVKNAAQEVTSELSLDG